MKSSKYKPTIAPKKAAAGVWYEANRYRYFGLGNPRLITRYETAMGRAIFCLFGELIDHAHDWSER